MFKVYWTNELGVPFSKDEEDMVVALQIVREKRESGARFVTMVSEDLRQVGKSGVDAIENGKTPDGAVYDWSKSGRAGKPRMTDKIIVVDDH